MLFKSCFPCVSEDNECICSYFTSQTESKQLRTLVTRWPPRSSNATTHTHARARALDVLTCPLSQSRNPLTVHRCEKYRRAFLHVHQSFCMTRERTHARMCVYSTFCYYCTHARSGHTHTQQWLNLSSKTRTTTSATLSRKLSTKAVSRTYRVRGVIRLRGWRRRARCV